MRFEPRARCGRLDAAPYARYRQLNERKRSRLRDLPRFRLQFVERALDLNLLFPRHQLALGATSLRVGDAR